MNKNKYLWLIASYPRSGNTWCRIFISEILRLKNENHRFFKSMSENLNLNKDLRTGAIISDRNWLDDQLGITSSDLSFEELDQIRSMMQINKLSNSRNSVFHKVHDSFYLKSLTKTPIVSHQNFKGVIYLVRNPFDLAVSLKYFFSWDQSKSIDFLLNKNAELCGSTKNGEIQCRQFLGTWEEHYLSWSTQSNIPVLVVRYEDLVRKPLNYFFKISRFLNLTTDKSLVERAVNNISFEKISSLEDNLGGFKENLNFKTKFFRSGKVGEARKVLTNSEIGILKAAFSETIRDIYKKEFDYISNSGFIP